jgi:hypothetical protein
MPILHGPGLVLDNYRTGNLVERVPAGRPLAPVSIYEPGEMATVGRGPIRQVSGIPSTVAARSVRCESTEESLDARVEGPELVLAGLHDADVRLGHLLPGAR